MVIDLKIWAKLKKQIIARNISSLIIFFSVILFLILLIYFSPSKIESAILLIFFILFNSAVLFLLKQGRKKELGEIKNVIQRIRLNDFQNSDEIFLSDSLKELENEIKAMFSRTQLDIQNLKKLEQVRTEFLGNVSHELRTPIFSIQGYLETLLDGALNDPNVNSNFLQKAHRHTLNLNTLLNDLIDISMIESGHMKMSFRYFNISEFLKNVVAELKPEAEKKNLNLVSTLPSSNLELYGDKQRLKQALVNLIMNAIKYTEKGTVEAGVKEENDCGIIFVKDSGIGIAESDLPRIFERFYRVDKDRSRELGGTGLGLAIVKHIVEAHSSKIEVKSASGVGSEFSFRLKK